MKNLLVKTLTNIMTAQWSVQSLGDYEKAVDSFFDNYVDALGDWVEEFDTLFDYLKPTAANDVAVFLVRRINQWLDSHEKLQENFYQDFKALVMASSKALTNEEMLQVWLDKREDYRSQLESKLKQASAKADEFLEKVEEVKEAQGVVPPSTIAEVETIKNWTVDSLLREFDEVYESGLI